MQLSHRGKVALTVSALVVGALGLVSYKVARLGYSLKNVLPVTQYELTYALSFDGHGQDVRIRSFLPSNDAHQTVSEERDSSSGLHLTQQIQGANRVATWAGAEVPDRAQIRHTFKVLSHRMEYEIPSDLAVLSSYAASTAVYLRPEKEIQVDAPEIQATLRRIGADAGTLLQRIRRIYDLTSGLTPRAFRGTTD